MARFLVFILTVIGGLFLFRKIFPKGNAASSNPVVFDPEHPAQHGEEKIVACLHCGLHIPKSESLTDPNSKEEYYCCETHMRLGKRT